MINMKENGMSEEITKFEHGIWYDIETAPKDGTEVLLYGVCPYDGPYITQGQYTERYKCLMRKETKTVGVKFLTHWMPMPPPPK